VVESTDPIELQVAAVQDALDRLTSGNPLNLADVH
jgi:hypothetical protein